MPPIPPIDPKVQELIVKETSRAVEGLLKPRQILKIAKAESEAALIRAKGNVEVMKVEIEAAELKQAAFYRFQETAIREEQNLQQIQAQAQLLLSDGADPDKVDDDWLANYVDHARNVSNDEMRTIWSRLLAGEINVPGSVSRRTVNAAADLDRFDCERFTRLCRFCWTIGGGAIPLMLNAADPIFVGNGADYETLSHLESIGLIQLAGGLVQFSRSPVRRTSAEYFGEKFVLEVPEGAGTVLNVGQVELTRVGKELRLISGAAPLPEFRDYMLKTWSHLLKPMPG